MVVADLTHPAPARENDATTCGFICFNKSGSSNVCVDSFKEQLGNSRFLTSAQRESCVMLSHSVCLSVCL